MRVGPMLCVPLAAVVCSGALSYPRPPRGVENIPKLMADSALVGKGEVVEAAEVTVVSDPGPPHRTATAIVHVDRCFKGERPASEVVPVLFDNLLPPGGGPYVVLRKGDYNLFFFKPEKDRYVLVGVAGTCGRAILALRTPYRITVHQEPFLFGTGGFLLRGKDITVGIRSGALGMPRIRCISC